MKFDEIWAYQNEGYPSKGGPKFQLFNHSCYIHEIFRICRYQEKIKFDKIWDTKMMESFSNKDAKTQNLTTYAGLMKFSE